ncbi:uncharacterized protein LOC123557055 [Mercenaria mercenaria]|uniref:uncharacterized protein LOC123557055 n=1 Tax=Mercenaria mercenaria TaxID=6596 RepID=UPI00234F6F64|nr:uncharacterized protein LOC123557055 [Mercenaria mercenaria]
MVDLKKTNSKLPLAVSKCQRPVHESDPKPDQGHYEHFVANFSFLLSKKLSDLDRKKKTRMAWCIARCNSVLQKNVRNGIVCFRKYSVTLNAAARLSHRTLISHLEDNRLKINHSGSIRTFRSSIALLKRFKESDYETVRVIDPSGQFLCNAEMLVLEKFCHRFHRFTFQEFKPDNKDYSENAVGDGSLRVFQLMDKRKEKSQENKQTKTKVIKFHKNPAAEEKMSKVWEILVDKGKVDITFDEKENHVTGDVMKMLQVSKNIKVIPSPDKTVYLAYLSDIDFDLLQSLFEGVQKQEADHIAKVKEMLKTMDGQ